MEVGVKVLGNRLRRLFFGNRQQDRVEGCSPGKVAGEQRCEYKADFLWPNVDGSVEQAGYEFANAKTEAFREDWWNTLCERAAEKGKAAEGKRIVAKIRSLPFEGDKQRPWYPADLANRLEQWLREEGG
jgi:hypothetical protein